MGREVMKYRKTTRSSRGAGAYPVKTDTNALKRGDQTGLETPLVHALNDAYSMLEVNKLQRFS
jgi:DNA-binding protein YbaB